MNHAPGTSEMRLRLATSRLMSRRTGLLALWQSLCISWEMSRCLGTVIMPADPDVVLRRIAASNLRGRG